MPRLVERVMFAANCSVALPANVIFVAALDGAVPSPESALTFKMPPLIVVPPV